jgi:putative transposase
MRDLHAHFEPDHFYHVYNRGNDRRDIFLMEENYTFFLKKWIAFLDDYVDVFTYCLMPNHFHFLIRVMPGEILRNKARDKDTNSLIVGQFKRLFSSYTLSFNKYFDRTGSLFQKRFKRVKVDSENYLLTLIHYIHHNPVHHRFSQEFSDWKYSSYSAIISDGPTNISRKEVLNFFGGKKAFLSFHSQLKNYKKINHLLIDQDI